MARHLNTTHSFVNRVWRAYGLKPHLLRTFKLSNDPRFEEKLRDVVGLYLDPPHNAAVFSFDEKSQIQALDRTQPGLPMKKGRCATMTHDYKRHGTTTLFAALNMATGEVIGKTYRKHRHQEVLRFLREVEETVPKEQEIHIVLDNYATHKHEKVLAWIERKKRVFLHFIPTSVRIPVQPDHRIRRKPITDSDSTRSLIPDEPDHRFRCQADHFFAAAGIVQGVWCEGARGAG